MYNIESGSPGSEGSKKNVRDRDVRHGVLAEFREPHRDRNRAQGYVPKDTYLARMEK